ncbi:MAG TPA: hypothetical protein VG276_27625 [Actinomycetes bacterium]|nr:hypothetical protein [Actinomycetes bacterium]
MDDERQDPRGTHGAPGEEPVANQAMANEREEVDEDSPTTDPIEVSKAVEHTIRFDFAGLRAIPVIPPDLFRAVREHQEELAKTASFSVLASNVLRDAFRPGHPAGSVPGGARAPGGAGKDVPKIRRQLQGAASCRCSTQLAVR